MIQNQWYGILDARELKNRKLLGVTRLGEKLVLWRNSNGEISCLRDQCCHRGASLSQGRLDHDTVQCPFHGFAYDVSGKVQFIPANGKKTSVPDRYQVHAYRAAEKYGLIWVWYGNYDIEPPEIPFFRELRRDFTYGHFAETWPVHYSRAIENQLDVVHLPFVHSNSIGRGCRTLVNGPVVTWEDNLMTFYVDNTVDDGIRKPLKPQELTNYQDLFSLQFQMPNIWQNRISDNVRIVAIFAPIDDGHTRIYLRFYQRFVKIRVLAAIINHLSNIGNRFILHQDRRVVINQLPIKTSWHMHENLIQGDAPIMEYRKRRLQLQKNQAETLP